MYISSTPPKGWLLCDGSGYATATYPALYATIGTTYGSTSGFQVPNLQARVPIGQGGSTSGALAATGGASTVTLTASESGYPSHSHSTTDTYATSASAVNTGANYSDYNPVDVAKNTGNNSTTNVSATSSHENRMPYYTLAYIIKAF